MDKFVYFSQKYIRYTITALTIWQGYDIMHGRQQGDKSSLIVCWLTRLELQIIIVFNSSRGGRVATPSSPRVRQGGSTPSRAINAKGERGTATATLHTRVSPPGPRVYLLFLSYHKVKRGKQKTRYSTSFLFMHYSSIFVSPYFGRCRLKGD